MLRLILALILVIVPMAWTGYLGWRLLEYQKDWPERTLWSFESLRPDRYRVEGLRLLYWYWGAFVLTLLCAGLVVGVIHP